MKHLRTLAAVLVFGTSLTACNVSPTHVDEGVIVGSGNARSVAPGGLGFGSGNFVADGMNTAEATSGDDAASDTATSLERGGHGFGSGH
ncbi:MAG TPA: hypothetical protein VF625_06170 [Longimicrobium sp.]|jgi:hypothetical protein